MGTVRIGILGAARIAPSAVIKPARNVGEATVGAVAARDRARADSFAAKHGIPTVHDSYAALLADPDIDAIYNPLPNGLHAEWTIAALDAGKPVLCEKPFTANAQEAEQVADTAARTGLVVMEAFHYRYHPLARRMREIVESGELGKTLRVETSLCFPLPKFSDIRYQYDLAGGATMDVGTYTVHIARLLGCEEPDVRSAEAKLHSPNVDRAMRAELAFPSGHAGRVTCSMWSKWLIQTYARVIGDRGELHVINPTNPQMWHRMRVKAGDNTRTEKFTRRPTYEYQLEAFCAAVLRGEPTLTPPADSIANMRVLDAIYVAAGMTPPRHVSGHIEAISAVTLLTADMRPAVAFYEALGFELLYGGSTAAFTSFAVGAGYLNLQLDSARAPEPSIWGRVIFWVDDVDAAYARAVEHGYATETEPSDASWGERYFHVRDPDGHELSFARPL